MTGWSPDSWKTRPASQLPEYPDEAALRSVLTQLAALPPLVTSWEVEELRRQLASASRGEQFLLMGGDCAESFEGCRADVITAKLKILLQMSLVLVHASRRGVIRVGRIAGQYAKPRSAPTEIRDGIELPTYRGDIVNRPGFSAAERIPDPQRLLRAYERAALTLNFTRALTDGGFADLHHPEYWDLDFAANSPLRSDYERIIGGIRDAVHFAEAVAGQPLDRMRRAEIFTGHEGLSLYYEQAQTRRPPRRDGWYNLSTHLPWLGMRTAQVEGAHVEYFRGLRNPVGVKLGPGMTREWLRELLAVLHPDNEPGRLVLIHRLGAGKVEEFLPPLIEEVKSSGKDVLWCADPMHGNTETTARGRKTRSFDRILQELEESFSVHEAMGSRLGGVHFEMTGEDVTECIGGARGLDEDDLERAYESPVDPRLNYEQALEMAMRIARHLRRD